MSSDLTLPGTIPGLLRKCSPVHVDGRGGGVVVDKPGDKVGWFRVLCDGCEDEPDAESRSCVHLDLTDATGRAHALWWLAAHTPQMYGADPASGCDAFDSFSMGFSCVGLRIRVEGVILTWRCAQFMMGDLVCPLLTDLDPDDDTRLPDGSRWVDAEALRRVVLHVAGVPA